MLAACRPTSLSVGFLQAAGPGPASICLHREREDNDDGDDDDDGDDGDDGDYGDYDDDDDDDDGDHFYPLQEVNCTNVMEFTALTCFKRTSPCQLNCTNVLEFSNSTALTCLH